jgi:hypothetical protein
MGGKFGDPLEDILRCVRGEIGDQFVVDGEIRRHNKEVVNAVGQVEIADECAHEAGLADACGKGKAQGRELPLEISDSGKFVLNH